MLLQAPIMRTMFLPTQLQGIRCESLKNEDPFQKKKTFSIFCSIKGFQRLIQSCDKKKSSPGAVENVRIKKS